MPGELRPEGGGRCPYGSRGGLEGAPTTWGACRQARLRVWPLRSSRRRERRIAVKGFRAQAVYDVVVVGGGHAGCEAALAAARMGCRTAMVALHLDNIALMPCNPAVGGVGKGQLTREVDALGGEQGRNTDRAFIQIKMLNTSKGPAVRALRAQTDKRLLRGLDEGGPKPHAEPGHSPGRGGRLDCFT